MPIPFLIAAVVGNAALGAISAAVTAAAGSAAVSVAVGGATAYTAKKVYDALSDDDQDKPIDDVCFKRKLPIVYDV